MITVCSKRLVVWTAVILIRIRFNTDPVPGFASASMRILDPLILKYKWKIPGTGTGTILVFLFVLATYHRLILKIKCIASFQHFFWQIFSAFASWIRILHADPEQEGLSECGFVRIRINIIGLKWSAVLGRFIHFNPDRPRNRSRNSRDTVLLSVGEMDFSQLSRPSTLAEPCLLIKQYGAGRYTQASELPAAYSAYNCF